MGRDDATHPDPAPSLVRAGQALARCRLVTAFGHVSARLPTDEFAISPPVPLDRFAAGDVTRVPLAGDELPVGVPKEAWIHRAIYAARPEVGAICRAQPPIATAVGTTDEPMRPLHGQGAFLGDPLAVHQDSRLVRDRGAGTAVAEALGAAPAVLLRGNGAVTVGPDIGYATALMWVLEASAQQNATARAAGTAVPLPAYEQDAWRAVAPELLGRIWNWLEET